MSSVSEACPFCGSTEARIPKSHHTDGIEYKLLECRNCGMQFWTPFKNPGSSWYEHDTRYANRNKDPILIPSWAHVATMDFYADKKPGTVLDVGCGVGNFLAYAQRFGWEGWGIDFDGDAIEAGKRAFDLRQLEVADIEEFHEKHPAEEFSLVSFFDVFEHLDNPTAFIASIKKILRPKGDIALSTPYSHAWRWLVPNDLPPRHLTRSDDAVLTQFLKRNGFTVRHVQRYPASLYFITLKLKAKYGGWTSFGLVQAVRNREQTNATKASNQSVPSTKARLAQRVAKLKDLVLFGIPALIIWIALYPTRKRYTDFMLIATLDS